MAVSQICATPIPEAEAKAEPEAKPQRGQLQREERQIAVEVRLFSILKIVLNNTVVKMNELWVCYLKDYLQNKTYLE